MKICQEYYQTRVQKAPELYQGMDSLMNAFVGFVQRHANPAKRLKKKQLEFITRQKSFKHSLILNSKIIWQNFVPKSGVMKGTI
ncbi:MAG: hypothetical protein OMM_07311 [Candidatus Magnetoglobus multicellularis str. Araruama]|uniref:Uncharacterized protein n=1 Tax=Candidatus Magnetoglobus multicellularis str. Araruama TaxID=890399 RepID=A0A1V1PD95_9BACT|nr:MAG: hypothetical protein OMM_07311 [Candidatus Magnetoglobus multicellularis str. Araruama]